MGLSGLRNLATNLKQGYELGRMPAQEERKDREQDRLDKLAESLINYRKMNMGKAQPLTQADKDDAAFNLYKRKEDFKITENVDDAATDVRKTMRLANELKGIIKKNPNSTGYLAKKSHGYGFGTEATGQVAEKALVLQAQLMKLMSKLGGVGIAKIVGRGKVDIGNSPASNLGVIKSILEGSSSSYKELRTKNQKHGGQTLTDIQDLYQEAKPEAFKEKFKDKADAIAYGKSLSPEKRAIFLKQLQGGSQ
jgi:hypothetical protein